jgi:hypothetical protein
MSLILGANQLTAGGYEIDNSLRFNSGSSDFLNRTPASSGNRKTWTWSSWVKKSVLGSGYQFLFSCTDASNSTGSIGTNYNGDNKIYFRDDLISLELTPSAVHRDLSAWYHIVVALDTTQATASNRAKIWINGEQITSFSTSTYPTQNSDGSINLVSGSYVHRIGTYAGSSNFFNGYASEINFIDGQALDPTSFGETDEDTNIWKPIPYTGSFGTNGFYLEFKDSSALGDDTSGNGNDFTVNNLTSIDQTTDTPTNNFATLNSLIPSNGTTSDGNLTYASSNSGSNFGYRLSTIGVSSGKWYVECKPTSGANASVIGIRSRSTAEAVSHQLGYYADDYGVYVDGRKFTNNVLSAYGVSYTTGDIIGIALDLDNNKLYFSKNGTFMNSGVPTSGATGTGAISITASSSSNSGNYFFGSTNHDSSNDGTWSWNFGNPPFTISSGNADGDGFGNFEYAVPSGYFALCTKNLADYG